MNRKNTIALLALMIFVVPACVSAPQFEASETTQVTISTEPVNIDPHFGEFEPVDVVCYEELLWDTRFSTDFIVHQRWARKKVKAGERPQVAKELTAKIDEVVACFDEFPGRESLTRAWSVIYANMSVALVEYVVRNEMTDEIGLTAAESSTHFMTHYDWATSVPRTTSATALKAKVRKILNSEAVRFSDWAYARATMEIVMKLSW